MQQVVSPNVQSLPNKGYLVSNEEKKEKFYKNESHIHKQNLLSGVKADAHKLYNDVFTYFPKGFAGSKNSDFYEYLSLGMVPYLIGSAMLIGLYGARNHKFNNADAFAAGIPAKQMAAGVVMYGVGKWAFKKLARAAIKASTSVDLDMLCIKKINELPEPGQEKGIVREQLHKVFGSVQFPREDLLAKNGEIEHNDLYYHDDKVTKKAGYENKLNASNQTASDKRRRLATRTIAMENIGQYIVAATGVALGSQEAFGKIKYHKMGLKGTPVKEWGPQIWKSVKSNALSLGTAFKDGAKQLWKGSDRNLITKHYGKALAVGSGLALFLTWLIPVLGFKNKPDTIKTKVDTNKEYEVC